MNKRIRRKCNLQLARGCLVNIMTSHEWSINQIIDEFWRWYAPTKKHYCGLINHHGFLIDKWITGSQLYNYLYPILKATRQVQAIIYYPNNNKHWNMVYLTRKGNKVLNKFIKDQYNSNLFIFGLWFMESLCGINKPHKFMRRHHIGCYRKGFSKEEVVGYEAAKSKTKKKTSVEE